MFAVGELVKFDAIRGPDDARCKWRATNVIALDGSGCAKSEIYSYCYKSVDHYRQPSNPVKNERATLRSQ